MKKLTAIIIAVVVMFAFNNAKGCDCMALTPQQQQARDKLLATGKYEEYYDARTGTNIIRTKGTGTTSDPYPARDPELPSGTWDGAGGIGSDARRDSLNIENQSPGWEGSVLDSDIVSQQTDPLADYMNEMKRLADAQRQSRIAGLAKARDSALSGLDAEKATIDPYYYDKRNQAAGQSDVGAMNFAQFMAGRGIQGSAGAIPEMYRNNALQGQIGGLNRQQAAEHSDIARRRSGVESAYQSDVASANADIDAQTMQNMLSRMTTLQDMRRAQEIADKAAMGQTSTGQLTISGRNAQNSEYERQAGLVAAANYADIMAEIDRRKAINPNDPLIPYLYAARQQKMSDQAEAKATAAAAAGEAAQQAWENAYKAFQSTGKITSPEQAEILGLPPTATVADIDIARMNAATSRINANKPAAQPKEPAYNYNTDANFQSEIADIMGGRATLQDVIDNATALQAAYGYDGYMELVQAATPKK